MGPDRHDNDKRVEKEIHMKEPERTVSKNLKNT